MITIDATHPNGSVNATITFTFTAGSELIAHEIHNAVGDALIVQAGTAHVPAREVVCPTCSAVDSIRDGACTAFGRGCGYGRPEAPRVTSMKKPQAPATIFVRFDHVRSDHTDDDLRQQAYAYAHERAENCFGSYVARNGDTATVQIARS